MSLLDLLLALIVVSSVIAGYSAGFARVGIGFCAAILGILFGFWFYAIPGAWIHKFISSQLLSNVLGFVVVFWTLLLVGTVVSAAVAKIFRWTGLSWLDRLAGAGFGVIRGAVIGVAFVAVLLAFSPRPLPNWMVTSQMLPYAVEASDVFASLAPAELKLAFREGLTEIRKDWDDQLRKSRLHRGLPPDPKRTTRKEYI